MPTQVTDYPVLWLTVIGAAITLAVSFGVHINPDQVHALGAFFAAVWAVLGIWGHSTTVPKTPSSTQAPLQTPPPGAP